MKLFFAIFILLFCKTEQNSFTFEDEIGNTISIESELPEKIDSKLLKTELKSIYFLGNDFPKIKYHIHISRIKKIKKNTYYLSTVVMKVNENNSEELLWNNIEYSVYEFKTEKNNDVLKIQNVNYQFSKNTKDKYERLPQFLNK